MNSAIIPSPRHQLISGEITFSPESRIVACLPADCPAIVRLAAKTALDYLTVSGCSLTSLIEAGQQLHPMDESDTTYRLQFVIESSTGEGYRLRTGFGETVFYGSPQGLLHAVQSWKQLLLPVTDSGEIRFMQAEIEDEPDIPVRGVFAECFNGSDLMQLEDWHALIDELVSLKLNTLSIGLNGAWPMRFEHPDSRLDFLFAPIIDDPSRLTPKQITYYDPVDGEEKTLHYQPPIYEHDLLGAIMRYAVLRGVRVIPLFNGPGHTTVLSQLYPQISAKDANGNPTGFGYSLTHPETLPMLKRIYTRLVEQYMKPNGQTWVHIGCDEVHPYHYMNDRMSDKAVSPWCCEDLKLYSKKQLFFTYIREIGSHLLELGIEKIIIWHDGIQGMFGYDEEFEQMLEQSGLAGKLVIHWWRYHEPPLAVSTVKGAENWVAPASGYFPQIVYQDFLDNIDIMVNEGTKTGAQAVVSYALYSPLQHRNTAFLAEKSWNTKARVVPFEQNYSRWLCGGDDASTIAMEEGLRRMRQVFGQYGHCYFLIETSIYFGNYYPRKSYPARILNTLANNEFGVDTLSRLLALDLSRALDYFSQAIPRPDRKHLYDYNIMECTRTKGVLDSLLHYAAALRSYEQVRIYHPSSTSMLSECYSRMVQALQSIQSAMEIVSALQVDYYLPASLREYTPLVRSIQDMLHFLEPWRPGMGDDSNEANITQPSAIPPVPLKGIRLEVYPNPRLADLDEA